MDNKAKFQKFLESMKGMGHDRVVDTLHEGLDACFEGTSEQRYFVQLGFYVHAENDESAVEHAKMVAKERRDKYDDRSVVMSVESAPFGSLSGGKEIYKV